MSKWGEIREALGLKQADLALLLGVHPVTVCRWETGHLVPSQYQQALLLHFRKAARHKEAMQIAQDGVLRVLERLLSLGRQRRRKE